jgi:ubiquinone/menaquinone biosynthesis C-methylase UbiE
MSHADNPYMSPTLVEGWREGAARRAAMWGAVTEQMIDLALLRPGMRVLDVGAGTGDQTLIAARRVGPDGRVLATDVVPGMLAVTEAAARDAGLANVETRVMDARDLDLEPESVDAAIARLVIMLIPEPHEAVTEIRRVLAPGARLSALVFSSAERNPGNSIPLAIARRRGNVPSPAPGSRDMFALGSPGVFEATLKRGGFQDVEVHVVAVPRRFASAAESVAFQRTSFPVLIEIIDGLHEAERESTWDEIEEALRQFEGRSGCEIPGEMLIGVGTK